jgi:hypothetical protein
MQEMDDKTLTDLLESLSREIAGMHSEMRNGFQRIEARLARQGGIMQGGSRQVARLVTWSEEVDLMIAERDATIEDLTRRVAELEKRLPPGAAA